ncbi:PLP-dependent transferase [Xylariaceae sp. FL1019]|nr:PLP-dependent transferase [Xylariaceae sp. FL1019]
MSDFDIESVRSKFPALSVNDQVFFDNAGGSQALGSVIGDIRNYLSKTNVQLGASYKTGKLSNASYDEGKAAGAKYVHAADSEVVFGPSTTQLFRNISYTLSFAKGDEIIVSNMDHEANIAPWVDLAERQELKLIWWTPPFESESAPRTPSLSQLLSPRTRLISCTHASNLLGSIMPIKDIVSTVRDGPSPDALVAVDGVSYAPHRPIDMRALGIDFYAFSWYKVYGPHIAMAYASPRGLAAMKSLGHFFNKHSTLEQKIGLAGASYELVAAIPSVVSYLTPTSWTSMIAHEQALQATLLEYLKSRSDIKIYGDTTGASEARVATVSFKVAGWASNDVVEALDTHTNFGVRWGLFYSDRLGKDVLGLGDDGVVRASMVHYNTLDEVKRFIEEFEKVVRKK